MKIIIQSSFSTKCICFCTIVKLEDIKSGTVHLTDSLNKCPWDIKESIET